MLDSLVAGEQGEAAGPALADFLQQQREQVLQDWASRVREQLSGLPTGPPRPLLRELAPGLLEQLAERLGTPPGRAPAPSGELPGPLVERLAESFEAGVLFEELALLRFTLLTHLERAAPPTPRPALTLLNAAFDAELAGLQRRFTRARARGQEALERVLQACTAPGPASGALQELLRALTEGTAALDSAAVHRVEGPGLQPVAAAGGAAQAGALAQRALQERRALSAQGAGPPEAPAGTRLLLVLPLLQGQQTLGVLQVGSRSASALSPSHRRLVELAAQGAAAVLARDGLQARLGRHARAPSEAAQQHLQLLVDAAPVVLWSMDAQGTIQQSEGQALQGMGLRPGEAVGRSAFEFAHKGHAALRDAWQRALRGESGSYESSFDGRTHFTRYQPLRGEDGRVQRIICVSVDITERRRAEEEGALLRMVVEQCSDGILVVGTDGQLLLANQQAQRQLGRPVEAVPPQQWVEFYGISSVSGQEARLEDLALYRALKGEEVRNNRWRVRRPDGSRRTVVGDATPLRRPDGSLVGAVLTTQDDTEREELEVGLRESEESFRAVFEGAAIGIAIADLEGHFLRTNPAIQRLSGYSDAELSGLSVEDLTPSEDLAVERPLFQQLLEGKREPYEVERRYVTKDGRVGWCRLKVSLGRGPDAQPRFLIALVEDLSERRRAEELERAAEFRERFMGILGHDLRNPLNAITLSGKRLLQQPLDAPQQRSVHRITHSAERMGRMVSDLLDFARARLGGGLPIVRRWVDQLELARNAVDEACAAHPDAQIELHVEGNTWGWWDADRMAQVLSNLLGNALQYRAPHTPVTVHLRDAGSEVHLAVCNRGGVIPESLMPHLFDPFRRGSESAQGHGHAANLGLGLFIVKQVVEAHGGSIEVSSDAEEGTAFRVRWPRDPPHETH